MTEDEKKQWKPIIQSFLDNLKRMPEEEVKQHENNVEDHTFHLELAGTPLNPASLKEMLVEDFGYENTDCDSNGWEWDFWWHFHNPNNKCPAGVETLMISGCGACFDMKLVVGNH